MINLARLRLRTGDGLGAYRLLAALYGTVAAKAEATLDGRTFAFNDLVTAADHPQVVSWLWTVLLADGTRALTRTGRWAEALDHLHRHKGLGRRLLDGRQTAILAHHARQDHHAAEQILASTTIIQPWEQAVATCLRLLHDHPTPTSQPPPHPGKDPGRPPGATSGPSAYPKPAGKPSPPISITKPTGKQSPSRYWRIWV